MPGFLSINQQSPDQRYTKSNQDDTVYFINDVNIVRRKAVSYFTCQHYFGKITRKNQDQAGNKDHQPLFDGMADKGCRGGKPENKNCRVQRIHKKARKEYFGIIPFPEFQDRLSLSRRFNFFKKKKIDAHDD